jgi:uncharacterized membrane protein YkvA (DUF1232 family)
VLERLKRRAAELKTQLLTLWFCRQHPDMPWAAKLAAILVVAYALSPIDLIPDFIPVLGLLDDLIIVPLGIYVALRLTPAHVLADGRRQALEWEASRRERPRNYWAAGFIVLAWVALACGLWKMLA